MKKRLPILIENPKVRSQDCPACNLPIGIMPGSRDAVCKNCGYKEPCCE